jgi:hypothetical protein
MACLSAGEPTSSPLSSLEGIIFAGASWDEPLVLGSPESESLLILTLAVRIEDSDTHGTQLTASEVPGRRRLQDFKRGKGAPLSGYEKRWQAPVSEDPVAMEDR